LDIDSTGTDVVLAALGWDFCKLCLKTVAPETVDTMAVLGAFGEHYKPTKFLNMHLAL
jgi:hypothetical protein